MADDRSRYRVLAALRREETDRIPFLEVSVDRKVVSAALGLEPGAAQQAEYTDPAASLILMGSTFGLPGDNSLELARGLGLDGLGMHFWVHHGARRDGSRWAQHDGGRAHQDSLDFNTLHLPDPDDPVLYEPYRHFVARYRDSGLALYCFLNLCSDPVMQGMGFETFSLALFDDRGLVEDMFDLYAGWYERAVRNLCRLGFDFLWFGDDIAYKSAPFVSPRLFRTLFMPRYRRVAAQCSLPWVFHSDGNLLPILDDLLDLGLCGLHPLEPEAMGIGEVKRRYGDRICLVGGISVDTLSRGSPGQVDDLVRTIIHTSGRGGGYIAGSSNSITWYCRPENVAAMRDAIAHYGQY